MKVKIYKFKGGWALSFRGRVEEWYTNWDEARDAALSLPCRILRSRPYTFLMGF